MTRFPGVLPFPRFPVRHVVNPRFDYVVTGDDRGALLAFQVFNLDGKGVNVGALFGSEFVKCQQLVYL